MAESNHEPIRRRAVSNCGFAPQSVASNGTLATQRPEISAQRQPSMSIRRLSLVQRNSSSDFNDDFRLAFSNSEHRSLLRTGDAQNGVSNAENPEYERVENWLDEHPDFVADYFVRKASYRNVLSWLDRRAASTSMPDENWTRVSNEEAPSTSAKYTVKAYRADESKLSVKIDFAQLRCSLRNSLSGVSTPSRRVSLNSVSERLSRRNEERPFPCTNGAYEPSSCAPNGAPEVCTEPQNEQSAENGRLLCDLLVDLCSANDDAARMCHRVALAVCQLVGCEFTSLFTLAMSSDVPPATALDETKRGAKLVCRALNVGPHTSSEPEGAHHPLVLPVGPEGGLIGIVAHSGEPTCIDDAYSDERFNRELDITSGCRSRSVLIMPVKTRDGEVVGVVVAANKMAGSTVKFTVSLPTETAAKCASALPDTMQNADTDLMIARRASSGHCRKLSQSEHGQRASTGQNGRKNSQPELGSHRLIDQCLDARLSPSAAQNALAESGKRKQGQAEAIHPHKYCRSERSNACFSKEDELVLGRFMVVCAMVLRNAAQLERSQLENRRSEVLLELAGCIFREQVDLHELIYKIMMYAQSLSRCERCQLLLIDDSTANNKTADTKMGMFNQVYDLSTETAEPIAPNDSDAARFPISLTVSEYVATTGETINTADLERDHRFASHNCQTQPDNTSLNATRRPVHSVLCMPIKNGQDQVIGVCLLANKLGERGAVFERDDERFFEAFTLFCGLGIHQTKMYERAIRAVAKQRVALEVLSYHATASIEEAQRLRKMNIPTSRFYQLYDFGFCDFSLTDDDTLKCTLRMFIDLRLVETFRIDYGVLCRFVLSVKKNYRNVTYHNWRHAFNVAQSMFAIVKSGSVDFLSDVEKLGLLVACLCHDLDHRGTNNQFQIKSASALAQLYSTSVMEHHHFDQACMLLQAKGNEIFANLDPDSLAAVMRIIEASILATDLAEYFRERNNFFTLVDAKADFDDTNNRATLRKMLMTACDVSAIYKPWDVQRRVAELVFSEFFEQGDLEKTELHLQPADMMDRDKKDRLPAMQVNFIDSICMPIYAALAKFNDRLSPMLVAVQTNRRNWSMLAEAHASGTPSVSSSTSESRATSTRELNRPESTVNTNTAPVDSEKEKDKERRLAHD